jgi:hypothetical protein
MENNNIENIDLSRKLFKIIKRSKYNIKRIKFFKRIIQKKSIFKRN